MALSSWARFSVWALCILVAAVSVVALLAGASSAWWVLLALVFSALALRGLADGLQTRTSRCGRDYRVKSAVLVEITFCGYPSTVPDIVMTNVLAKVPA